METANWALMKEFSSVLKNKAKAEQPYKQISKEFLKFFSRKELIEIIHHIHQGQVPSEIALVDMENEELLEVIGDDLSIISYVCNQWNKGLLASPPPDKQLAVSSKAAATTETSTATQVVVKKDAVKKEGDKVKS
jgi:hypothetical protein